MKTEYDAAFMRRAIELAKKGNPFCHPNPLVGAVIVRDGRILAEGWHARYGGLHAEREAIRSLTEPADGAVLYVTLEPCCHQGKQPPCTDAVISAGIRTVVIGSRDPNPKVAGKGVRKLREAGITVYEDVLKDECDALNPVFFHYITKKMPYVRYKFAMTADGNTAVKSGESKWISSPASRELVQRMRSENMGIMVGIGTVLADDPMLTCRLEGESFRNPIRIILDSRLRIPMDSRIVRTAGEYPTIVCAAEEGNIVPADPSEEQKEKENALRRAGITVLRIPVNRKTGRPDLKTLMARLAEREIDSILLEGGGTLAANALREGIIQEADAFIAPKLFGGRGHAPMEGEGVALPEEAWKLEIMEIRRFADDFFIRYRVKEEDDVYGDH
ncbi:MAG: bifunctional diaminohydroxyphosphoribosylaminopyrimidine deaminase/5-amino-6-(5-phosphoribosylamino)uracil reductase RibD [Bacillota bacterium]|nr:bifunctional diaminohydroxyphosphoribosylaminopyrimidine deaminase/5-amino-6-(5-phosphoribosylamino)uracil reductase RibD [Bacillota bacterium]